MAINETFIDATPEKVFGVLSEPDNYGDWVVGSSKVRHADAGFPARGSKFGHTVGIGSVGVKDTTDVLETEPPRRLVLRAKARPLGMATVRITLAPEGSGTRLTIDEVLDGGLGGLVPRVFTDPVVKLRNTESLRRLKRIAESERPDQDSNLGPTP